MTLETYYHRRFPLDLQEAVRRYSHKFGDEDYFHVQDFVERVPSVADGKYRHLFVCLCALGVLMDEVVFTHFSGGYTDFRYLTMFPKVEYGITGTHANPWVLLREKRVDDGLFENCASVFFRDMRSLISEVPYPFAAWKDLEAFLIADKDVSEGRYGELLLYVLKNDLKARERPQDDPNDPKYLRHILSDEEIEELGR